MSADRERSGSGSLQLRRGLGLLASLVRLVCGLIALLLVLFIIFTLGQANPANGWAMVIGNWAPRFNLGLASLFQIGYFTVLVNYGIAAIIWLVIGAVLSKVLGRI